MSKSPTTDVTGIVRGGVANGTAENTFLFRRMPTICPEILYKEVNIVITYSFIL